MLGSRAVKSEPNCRLQVPLHKAASTRHVSAFTAGAALARASVTGQRLRISHDIPNLDAIETCADAYNVQKDAAEFSSQHFALNRVGWKIGATNATAQQRMGLTEPFYGPVFQTNLAVSPATVSIGKSPFRVRGVEAEYAFLIGDDLPLPPGRADSLTRAEVETAVAAIYPAIEVCGSRLAENPPATPTSSGVPLATLLSISDQASHGSLVRTFTLAKSKAVWDGMVKGGFEQLAVTLTVNGKAVATGSGSDVLGDPLHALTWLANALVKAGTHLRSGDIVTSGTMTGLTPVAPGDVVRADFAGFGTVEVAFTE